MSFKIKNSVKLRKSKDSFILFDIETEKIHKVNNAGYEIIKLCNGKKSLEDIGKILSSEFENMNQKEMKSDIRKFIRKLEMNNLLKIIPSKITDRIELFKSELGSYTYNVEDENTRILVDAGVYVKKPIDLIMITHCHYDHILFLNELKNVNDCEVVCSRKEKKAIEGFTDKVLMDKFPKMLKPVKIDKTVKEGDRFRTKNFDFEVFETPGHTNGSISFYEKNKGVLFSGDAWFGDDNQGKWIYPSGSKRESRETLKKLKKLKPKIICPGHWGVIRN